MVIPELKPRSRLSTSFVLAGRALRTWSLRQVVVALVSAVAIGLLLGIATVLIPNQIFARDIPPVWWNYPVWILTSVMSGMLIATYVRRDGPSQPDRSDVPESSNTSGSDDDVMERRTSRLGLGGAVLAWFAVGCPVCNKIALLALGYSGAITWFTPIQPFLAVGAFFLTGIALLWRLRGQVACPVKPQLMETAQ